MIAEVEWMLILLFSMGFTALAFAASIWMDARRAVDARALSLLGERVGMRYRVLGRDHLDLPERFVLHERPRSAAGNSMIERSLVTQRADGLPAVFEYITYRDRAGLRRSGAPFLVLVARLPDGVAERRLRPPMLVERVLRRSLLRAAVTAASQERESAAKANTETSQQAPDWSRIATSGLWVQVHARTLYVGRPDRWWRRGGFTPSGIDALVGDALPLLQALRSPDTPVFEALAGPSEVQATGEPGRLAGRRSTAYSAAEFRRSKRPAGVPPWST